MPLCSTTCSALATPTPALRHVEPEQLRRQILYAVRTIIERRLALSPLLIVVEDLHWADAVSLEALRFVMDRLERTRLMLLVTHRPALDDDRSTRAGSATPRCGCRRSAATTAQAAGGACSASSWGELRGSFVDRILERAGGNPLFVEEIVRGLIEAAP